MNIFLIFNIFQKANIWYNVWGNIPTMDMPEIRSSYQLAYDLIHDLIQNEVNNGIPENRIIIGKNLISESDCIDSY